MSAEHRANQLRSHCRSQSLHGKDKISKRPSSHSRPPAPTFEPVPTAMPPVLTNGEYHRLNCVLEGESIPFQVDVPCSDGSVCIADLKKLIRSARKVILKDVAPYVLELWKVSTESH